MTRNGARAGWLGASLSSALIGLPVLAITGCSAGAPPPPPPPGPSTSAAVAPPAPLRFDRLERAAFNRLAARLALPLFWIEDGNSNGAIEPGELAVLWGIADSPRTRWLAGAGFTDVFAHAYDEMVALNGAPTVAAGFDPAEIERRKLVAAELDQGRPTLVSTSFVGASPEDRAIAGGITEAARLIERLFARQNGSYPLLAQLPLDDPSSRMLFYRNQGPWCVAPATEKEPHCSAIPGYPPKLSGLYPASLQGDEGFCGALGKKPNAKALRDHFTVVREQGAKLTAVPYHEAYAGDMKAVAAKLETTAAALSGGQEAALARYLLTAAQAFRDDSWEKADEAWAAMNSTNSRWYLRIAPDEVYAEPCNLKAGFHVSFARINPGSLAWQEKLAPVKDDMEQALAKLAGPPYHARKVAFHLPDFIDIVLNAGDSRSPLGATVGQSLPNWGKVVSEGRGRTVVMTNLYTDPDSRRTRNAQASSLLCAASMKRFSGAPEPQVMTTVLHEAAHNLGPAHEYAVRGKADDDVFGGPLASTLEELKAQTAALYFTDWLAARKLIDTDMAEQAHTADFVWAFGHISRGMYTASHKSKPYSQLAAIQLGFLMKEGAIAWRAEQLAANSTDRGCFELDYGKFPDVVTRLMRQVAGIKARGDKQQAKALVAAFVDDTEQGAKLRATIAERWLRAPKASFVYAIDL